MPQTNDQNTVSLKVNGKNYAYWQEVTVEASVNSLVRGCTVKAAGRMSGEDLSGGINCGDPVVVSIGDDVVLTGYITKKDLTYDGTTTAVTLAIQSKTIDLKECMIPSETGYSHKWSGESVRTIIKEIAGYYGIGVVVEGDGLGESIVTKDVSTHSKISEEIVKILQEQSLLIMDDGLGRLVIAKAESSGKANDALVLGKNVLSGKREHDVSKVFSHYAVVGQSTDARSERTSPGTNLKGVAINSNFPRKRWSVTEQSGNRQESELQGRAQNLMLNSVGNADILTYTVQGWRQSNGDLWKPNTLANVEDPMLGFSGKALISKVKFSLSSNGSVTTLELKSPFAFAVTDLPDKDKGKSGATKSASKSAKTGTTFLARKGSGAIK